MQRPTGSQTTSSLMKIVKIPLYRQKQLTMQHEKTLAKNNASLGTGGFPQSKNKVQMIIIRSHRVLCYPVHLLQSTFIIPVP